MHVLILDFKIAIMMIYLGLTVKITVMFKFVLLGAQFFTVKLTVDNRKTIYHMPTRSVEVLWKTHSKSHLSQKRGKKSY
jgi:hypothetical protein